MEEMIFGNAYNQEKREHEPKCYGFSMAQFIEKEIDRKKALGLTNIQVGSLPFQDLAIPFLYDSHDRVFSTPSSSSTSASIKKMKGGSGKNYMGFEVIPDKLFDQLFGLVSDIKPSNSTTTNTNKKTNRKTKKSRK